MQPALGFIFLYFLIPVQQISAGDLQHFTQSRQLDIRHIAPPGLYPGYHVLVHVIALQLETGSQLPLGQAPEPAQLNKPSGDKIFLPALGYGLWHVSTSYFCLTFCNLHIDFTFKRE